MIKRIRLKREILERNCEKKGADTVASAPEIGIKSMPDFNSLSIKLIII